MCTMANTTVLRKLYILDKKFKKKMEKKSANELRWCLGLDTFRIAGFMLLTTLITFQQWKFQNIYSIRIF